MRNHRIRNRLLQRRRELVSRYHNELALAAEELDSREIEEIENATELWDARVLSLLGDADVRALGSIVAALRRLDAGCYGRCVECSVVIEPQRLQALPEAATCYQCALDAELPRRAVG